MPSRVRIVFLLLLVLTSGFSWSYPLFANPDDLLFRALRDNDLAAVKSAIQQGARVDATDHQGTPAIFWAAYRSDVNIFRYLVSLGANLTVKAALPLTDGSYYGSLLCIAAGENKPDLLRYLVEELRLPVNGREYNTEEKLENGWTPLQWACNNSHDKVITYLLGKNADPEIYTSRNESPLFMALARTSSSALMALLEAKVNLTTPNSDGVAPVFYALTYHTTEAVDALIRKGADFTRVTYSEETPFQFALSSGYLDKALLLLERGADGNSLLPDGSFPLALAAKNGYADLVNALLAKGISPDTKDKSGRTALMYAAYNNQVRICRRLMQAGADLSLRSPDGKTALDFSREHQVPEAIAYLSDTTSWKEPTPWQTLNSEMVMYVNAHQPDKAIAMSQRALQLVGQGGTDHLDYASACLNHIRLLHHFQRYEESLPYFDVLWPVLEKNKDHRYYSEARQLQGSAFFQTGRYDKVIAWYQNFPAGSNTFLTLGEAYYKLNRFTEAEEFLNKAAALPAEKLPAQWRLWNDQALLYMDMGQYTTSERLLRKLMDSYRDNNSSEEYDAINHLMVIHNYSDLLLLTGRYTEAERYANYVRETMEAYKLTRQPLYTNVLTTLGNIDLETGRYPEAEVILKQALQAKASQLGKQHPGYANGLALLASAYLYQKRYALAEVYYDDAAHIIAETNGKPNIYYCTARANLATLYMESNQLPSAEAVMRELLPLMEQAGLDRTQNYAQLAGNMSNILNRQNKAREAITWQQKAVNLFRAQLPDHPYYFQALQDLGMLHYATGNLKEAYPAMKESMAGLRAFYAKTFSAMDEKKQLSFAALVSDRLSRYQYFCLSLLKKQPALAGELLDNTLAMKGIFLNIQHKVRQQIMQSGDSVQIHRYRDWLEARERLNKFYAYSRTELQAMNIDLNAWENRARQLEEEISRNASARIKPADISWRDLQKKLKPGEVAIETLFVNTALKDSLVQAYAFLLFDHQSTQPEIILLPNGQALNEKFFRYYQNMIKTRQVDELSYRNYWAPLSAARTLQGGKKTIFFSADGIYHQVGLAGLYHPETTTYLMEEHDLHQVTSLKDLVRQPATPNGEIVLLGYPTYNLTLEAQKQAVARLQHPDKNTKAEDIPAVTAMSRETSRAITAMELPELPGTKTEVETIEALAEEKGRRVKAFLGAEALEEVIKAVHNPSILHLATHGYFLKEVDEAGEGGKILGVSAQRLNENALLRSGLLFTGSARALSEPGNDDTLENGVLTAYEAMNLALDSTGLVVLSACETGLGEVKAGEGVYGLQRAFTIAGARTLLMSLWTVSDEATQVLMTAFYRHLFSGRSVYSSFALARQHTREQYPHPYYWSAFVLLGD